MSHALNPILQDVLRHTHYYRHHATSSLCDLSLAVQDGSVNALVVILGIAATSAPGSC
jgi:hypothetical protein